MSDEWTQQAAEQPAEQSTPEQQAVTPGTAVTAATTIDALFTAIFATRSGVTTGAPTYVWNTDSCVMGSWPDGSAMFARFEARPYQPNVLAR